MTKTFSLQNSFHKNKKVVLGGIVLLVLLLGVFFILSSSIKNSARKDMVLTIPAMGNLPALHQGMKDDALLRGKVKELLSYDENYLFVNYLQVDALVTDIMLIWVGLLPEQIQQQSKQVSAEQFIRRVYNLPDDEPIQNNPLLEKYPWMSLFQKVKSKLLMQGNGYKIYEGHSYYDSEKDKMVIDGYLSSEFAQSLSEFIKTQPQAKQKKYFNNYLMFVDGTLGLKKISDQERKFLKEFGFL